MSGAAKGRGFYRKPRSALEGLCHEVDESRGPEERGGVFRWEKQEGEEKERKAVQATSPGTEMRPATVPRKPSQGSYYLRSRNRNNERRPSARLILNPRDGFLVPTSAAGRCPHPLDTVHFAYGG